MLIWTVCIVHFDVSALFFGLVCANWLNNYNLHVWKFTKCSKETRRKKRWNSFQCHKFMTFFLVLTMFTTNFIFFVRSNWMRTNAIYQFNCFDRLNFWLETTQILHVHSTRANCTDTIGVLEWRINKHLNSNDVDTMCQIANIANGSDRFMWYCNLIEKTYNNQRHQCYEFLLNDFFL